MSEFPHFLQFISYVGFYSMIMDGANEILCMQQWALIEVQKIHFNYLMKTELNEIKVFSFIFKVLFKTSFLVSTPLEMKSFNKSKLLLPFIA